MNNPEAHNSNEYSNELMCISLFVSDANYSGEVIKNHLNQ